jgi:hypothetical protein
VKKIRRIAKWLLISVLVLILVLLITFFAIQKRTKQFDKTRVALVDSSSENYIFRGNNPFILKGGKKVFAYQELKNAFNETLRKANKEPLDDFYLIDASLLDLNEYEDFTKEKDFFLKNPQKGEFIHFSTISPGLLLKYSTDSNLVSKLLIERYNIQTSGFLREIHQIVKQATKQQTKGQQKTNWRRVNKPVVIYLHCNAGRDRTGFIVASYKMLFEGENLKQARLENANEAGRDSKNFYNRATASFCQFIKENRGKSSDFCLEPQDNSELNEIDK